MTPESEKLDHLEESLATLDNDLSTILEKDTNKHPLIDLFRESKVIDDTQLYFRQDNPFSDLNINIGSTNTSYQAWRVNGSGAMNPEKEWVFEKMSFSTHDQDGKPEHIAALALAIELVTDKDHSLGETETIIEFADSITDMETAIRLLASRDSITGPKLVFEKIIPRPIHSETFEVTTLSNNSNTSEKVTEKTSYSKYRVKFDAAA